MTTAKLTIRVHGMTGETARTAAVAYLAAYGEAPVGPVRSRGGLVFVETTGSWNGSGSGHAGETRIDWRRQRRAGGGQDGRSF